MQGKVAQVMALLSVGTQHHTLGGYTLIDHHTKALAEVAGGTEFLVYLERLVEQLDVADAVEGEGAELQGIQRLSQ